MIEELYKASIEGVKIEMIVRGICCLIPGNSEFSKKIEVKSIGDKYLEHTRFFIFCSGAAFVSLFVSFIVAFWNSEGFWPISANSSRAKNVLALAIRNCKSKNLEGIDKPTFENIGLPEMPLHSEWPQDIYSFYTDNTFSKSIEESDSCFSLAAKPSSNQLTWFSIKANPKNDVVIKKCGDSEKKHCEKGNTW